MALLGAALATGCALREHVVTVGTCGGAVPTTQVLREVVPASLPAAACGTACASAQDPKESKEPRVAMAVTRPSVCNDYPVSYRVTVPDVESRVRHVERVILR